MLNIGVSYRDLDEWMSVEDACDVLEVALVRAHNTQFERKQQELKARSQGRR
jgi:hypothetical protein